ncbi:TetR/AcrR family transcriptional regulator [Alkalibacterium sp. m-11]
MSDVFKSLEKAKQDRILNACYKEFTEKGFDQASTNTIAKEAGIGKGTLFYYFKSKEALFYTLIEEAFLIAENLLLHQIDFSETDFFERLKQTTRLKWDVYEEQPHALGFLASVFIHADKYDLPVELSGKRAEAEQIWGTVLTKNIEFTKFREDVPHETSFNFIRWTVEGYRAELEQRVKSQNFDEWDNAAFSPYYDEFNTYLDTLKIIYYKKDEL